MKKIAMIAATTSLAAITAPANAAEFGGSASSSFTTNTATIAPFGSTAEIGADTNFDRDRRNDRRYRNGRSNRDRVYDDRGRYREPRRMNRRDRVWRGRDGTYHCERDNGTTGLVIGAGLGALAGRTVDTRGDRTVGTLLGALAGGLLGREIDRSELSCR